MVRNLTETAGNLAKALQIQCWLLVFSGGRVGLRWGAVGLCEDEAMLKLIFNSSVKDLLLNDRIMRMMGS